MRINYLKGDATSPHADGTKIIVHICNDIGGWGKGFVLAISKKWKEPEESYREWHKSGEKFELGEVKFVKVEDDIIVANMIGQHDIRNKSGKPPIRYDAVDKCLDKVSKEAKKLDANIHMPRIGCGLAGGKWDEIEKLIKKRLIEKEIDVYVYDLV